jgi:hypothetical protein
MSSNYKLPQDNRILKNIKKLKKYKKKGKRRGK